jgi:thiol-disulfide isomerase/thioredoxin
MLGLLSLSLLPGFSLQANAAEAKVVDKAGFEKAIAAHQGKIVVVDCWATWCVPCLKQLPQSVALAEAHASDGVVLVTLNFDDVEGKKVPAKVTKWLTEKGGAGPHLVSAHSLSDDGAEIFGIADGALPHYLVYGRDGKLAARIASTEETPANHDRVEKAVQALLKRK